MTMEITVHTHYTTSQLDVERHRYRISYDLIGVNNQIIINNDN